MSNKKDNKILAEHPDTLRDIDGVTFDLDSYARHCQQQSASAATESAEPAEPVAPAPVFPQEPQHIGWYGQKGDIPKTPIMGGALPPATNAPQRIPVYEQTEGISVNPQPGIRFVRAGSGSYLTSYLTSYHTSYRTSYRSSGSYLYGSGVFPAGGYGLELI